MRHSEPLWPGSFTVVTSKARTWKLSEADATTPCSRNSSTHSACSQSRDFCRRFGKATSASSALRACTTVSRNEWSQPKCNSNDRRRLLGDLSFRSFLRAPVFRARSSQLLGRNDTSRSQSSFSGSLVSAGVQTIPPKSCPTKSVMSTNKLAPLPPNPLPQPSKRFARREGSAGSQGESQGRLPTSCQASQKTVPDEGQAADCFTACSGCSAPYAGPPRHPRSGRFSFGLTHGLTLLPPLAMMDPTPPYTVAPLSHLPQPQLSTIT